MNNTDYLLAISGVRNIKASYWYYLDTKQWDKLATVFSENATADFRGERDLKPGEGYDKLSPADEALAKGEVGIVRGRANIVAWIKSVVETWITIHHGHEPIIEIIDETHAKAIWPLFDYIDNGTNALKGYGHYHETYLREADGVWRIHTLQLTRLRSDGDHPAAYAAR